MANNDTQKAEKIIKSDRQVHYSEYHPPKNTANKTSQAQPIQKPSKSKE